MVRDEFSHTLEMCDTNFSQQPCMIIRRLSISDKDIGTGLGEVSKKYATYGQVYSLGH